MPTYVYETIPSSPAEAPERFEIRQGMAEDALSVHPDTGKPVRRVITGGLGYLGVDRNASTGSAPAGGGG
jgi:predicted nucleic acid-binding Zn ribbon protein